jgi:hypothetical protein
MAEAGHAGDNGSDGGTTEGIMKTDVHTQMFRRCMKCITCAISGSSSLYA